VLEEVLMRTFRSAFAVFAVVSLAATLSVSAQGISEFGGVQGAAGVGASGLHSRAGTTGGTLDNLYGAPARALGGNTSSSGAVHRVAQVHLGADGLPLAPDPRDVVRGATKSANKLYGLAVQQEKAGKLAEAEKYYSASLTVRHKIWGDTDPAVIQLYMKLGSLEIKLKHFDSAEPLYMRAFQAALKSYGMGSYELTPYLNGLGDAFYGEQKFSDAGNYYQQVKQLQSRHFGEDSKEAVVASLRLARAWVATNDKMYWPDADKLLKTSIAASEKSPDLAPQLIALLDVKSNLLTAEGKKDDAAKLTARADELRAQQAASQPASKEPAAASKESDKPDASAEAKKGSDKTDAGTPAATKGADTSPPAAAATKGADSGAPTAVKAPDKSDAKTNAVNATPKQEVKTAPPDNKETTPAKKGDASDAISPAEKSSKLVATTKSEPTISTKTEALASLKSESKDAASVQPRVVTSISQPSAVSVQKTETAMVKVAAAPDATAADSNSPSTETSGMQDPDAVANRAEKKAILHHLFDSMAPTWTEFCTDNFVNSDQSAKLLAISKSKDLTTAQKEQQKEEYHQFSEKKVARFKELMSQRHLDAADITLDLCVDAIDSSFGWSLDDYHDLDGLTRLVNHSKLKLPALSGKDRDAEWKAWGEKLGESLKPSIDKMTVSLSPVMTQMKLDEDSGKFGRLTFNIDDSDAPKGESRKSESKPESAATKSKPASATTPAAKSKAAPASKPKAK